MRKKSEQAFSEALEVLVGGVNSPVRSFKSVSGTPVYFNRAEGSKVFDLDGNEFIDYIGSWGPQILGHADETLVKSLIDTIKSGTGFGAPHEYETELAKLIIKMVPSVEKVRMVNSGTEATMSAIRLARGYTKRNKIIKFSGCYHGHGDSFLIKAGSGALTLGQPDSPGVPPSVAADTLIADYNDIDSVKALFENYSNEIAGVIIEPVAGNMGLVPGRLDFLKYLRQVTTEQGAVLIFDEVMTGFRLATGGAQELFGITPDLTTLGKIVGGGLPVGAYGGKLEIMDYLAPLGPVYQAGTLSGNPLSMAAGIAILSQLDKSPKIYHDLEVKGSRIEMGIRQLQPKLSFPTYFNRVGSMYTLFFHDGEVVDFTTAIESDTARFTAYFDGMLEQQISLPPSQFEVNFISTAHSDTDLDETLLKIEKTLLSI